MKKYSAGIILLQREQEQIKILLGHMAGPFWTKKDDHAWTIPKGEFDPENEDPEAAARREFEEETGMRMSRALHRLTPFTHSGKAFYFFVTEAAVNPEVLRSNLFAVEWPPKSGKIAHFPELDRFAWFSIDEAKNKITKGQIPVLNQLINNGKIFEKNKDE